MSLTATEPKPIMMLAVSSPAKLNNLQKRPAGETGDAEHLSKIAKAQLVTPRRSTAHALVNSGLLHTVEHSASDHQRRTQGTESDESDTEPVVTTQHKLVSGSGTALETSAERTKVVDDAVAGVACGISTETFMAVVNDTAGHGHRILTSDELNELLPGEEFLLSVCDQSDLSPFITAAAANSSQALEDSGSDGVYMYARVLGDGNTYSPSADAAGTYVAFT